MKLSRNFSKYLNLWTLFSFLIVVLILLPNLSILVNFFTQETSNWQHVKEYILPLLLKNTSIIIVFTGIFSILIGTSLAWLISAYDFPLRRFFKWGLILPLAIPPYIAAYTYNGILNYTGVIQTTLRTHFNIPVNQSYFDIMSLPGAIFIFTFFLFPYVYMITRAFLSNQSSSLIENARLLGRNSFEVFFLVVLPISRGAIVAGVSLVLLEVLNDYGVVQYFGIPTFSTAIFQTWFGMGDLNAAIKLSATLMFIVFAILVLEKLLRGRKRYSFPSAKIRPLTPVKLQGWQGKAAFIYCSIIFGLGFLIPFVQLVDWTLLTYEKIIDPAFVSLIINSLIVALAGSTMIIVFAVIIANFARIHQSFLSKMSARVIILGYSIPGAVIAVGIITVFIRTDNFLFGFYEFARLEQMLYLSTSLFMLVSAYVIRFLAVGFNAIESGYDKIGNSFTEASRMLGMGMTKSFFKVDLPLLKGAILSGFILSFIEILKELPLTLILRPFNFDTLSTKAFQYANDEQIHEAALASIIIIVISAVAIFVFHHILEKESK
ncbi:iron ABC transporter permease [Virgibacillus sp. C22-A2]|uniref:Iron ABC transporter permease n=1 Tax=Virgibacillus tibetensis TaxID=3042313 RepID=A0ABU6KIC6_9BACI|nr:iron ABC transporter permease [Virgibacillus sp. C22-A2]